MPNILPDKTPTPPAAHYKAGIPYFSLFSQKLRLLVRGLRPNQPEGCDLIVIVRRLKSNYE